MSLQSGSLGRFWLGAQTAKGSAASTYYGFKANMVDVSPGQDYRDIGQLVGGSLLPGGSIKTAAWSSGGLVMPPPLDDYIGWLLYAFAGSVSTVDNGDSTYSHYFPSGADSTAPGKYLTARRSVPGTDTLYEQMEDLVPTRLLWGLTPGEFTTLRADLVGRTPSNPDGSGWSYSAKDETSVPISCKGAFELPNGTEVETSAAVTMEMVNIVPNLREVLTLGSYYPFDFPVLGRAISVSFSHLWETKDLYVSNYFSAGDWSPTVYSSSLDLYVQSPGNITGSVPYELRFYAPSVDWRCQPVPLAGGELIRMNMVGTVTDYSSGYDWWLMIKNGTANYTWPT
jgi:hypothetical protein